MTALRIQHLHGILAALLGLACLRGGCSPGGPEAESFCLERAAPADGAEVVVLGRGVGDGFEPLMNEPELPLEFGLQGGQHVFVSLELYVASGSVWQHSFTLRDQATEAELGERMYRIEVCAPGWNRIEMIDVFVHSMTVTAGRLDVISGPVQDGTVDHTIGSSADIRIVPP